MLCHKQKARKFCTTKLIKMYIRCIYVFSFISNIPRIFEHHWDTSKDGNTTVLKTDVGCSYPFQIVYIIVFTMLIRLIIPVLLLAFSNIQLLRKVLNTFKKHDGEFCFRKLFSLSFFFTLAGDGNQQRNKKCFWIQLTRFKQ